MRVLLMELNRISSHLVCIATGGMEIGALTVMTIGFRERELVLDLFELITGLRMNHAFIRPGGVAQDLPAGRPRRDPRLRRADEEAAARVRRAVQRQPDLQGPPRGRRPPRPGRLPGAGHHRPGAARRPATRGTCARPSPTAATRTTTSTSRPGTPPTPTAASGSGSTRCGSRCKIVEQAADRLADLEGAPVMVADKKIAWPSQLAIGSDGMGNSLDHIRHIMGESMEALIHHFKLVTEGFRVPAGPGLRADRVAPRRAGRARRLRRRHPSVPGALPRPVVHQPAGDQRDGEGGRSPTSSSRSPPSTP